jgi:Mrp family chromosome partitioning ATPase
MTLHWGEPVGSAESFPEAPCWSVGQCLPHFDPQLLAEQDGESHVSGTVSTQQQPADDEEPVATLRSADPGSAPGEGPIVPVDEEAASPDAPRSQPPPESPPQPRSFTPAWEVDAFRWPELCGQLDEQTGGRLSESGEELQAAARDGLGVLAVTSCNRLEGRTTIALSLARAAASAGARVALVDADADHPQLARRLGMEAPCDWQEVVRLGQPLSEAAVVSLSQRVTLFPKAAATETHVQALTQPLLTVLEELTGHFDLVIVDLPPLEMDQPNETPISPCPIDMAVVARHVRCTSPEQAMAAAAALRSLGVRAVGVIENFGSPASGESSNSDRQSNAPGSD